MGRVGWSSSMLPPVLMLGFLVALGVLRTPRDVTPCHPPIDAVYTWVNGSDPWFRRLADRYAVAEPSMRFEDHGELKYSLRSLATYAPWIRYVFIVTDGQVPHWLNVADPKVRVVPHHALFPNTSHLPTFSSPAIEMHLHRIPGLTRRFLYLNDDVFLGSHVSPHDFFSDREGHLIYPAWIAPSCTPGCDDTWLGDDMCDIACNTTQCGWDGGDCLGPAVECSRLTCPASCREDHLTNARCDPVCGSLGCAFDVFRCPPRLSSIVPIAPVNQRVACPVVAVNLSALLLPSGTITAQCTGVSLGAVSLVLAVAVLSFADESAEVRVALSGSRVRGGGATFTLKLQGLDTSTPSKQTGRPLPAEWDPLPVVEGTPWTLPSPEVAFDTYGESLRYVGGMLTERFGRSELRWVPAHVPHLIDTRVVEEFQEEWAEAVDATSASRVRRTRDVQYAFSHFHWIRLARNARDDAEMFARFDENHSGYFESHEIRRVAAVLWDSEVELSVLWKECHHRPPGGSATGGKSGASLGEVEACLTTLGIRYLNTFNGSFIAVLLDQAIEDIRYPHTVVESPQHIFAALQIPPDPQLLRISARRPKFFCVNDQLNYSKPLGEREEAVAALVQFLDDYFPTPSRFETSIPLPYTHVWEAPLLTQWRYGWTLPPPESYRLPPPRHPTHLILFSACLPLATLLLLSVLVCRCARPASVVKSR